MKGEGSKFVVVMVSLAAIVTSILVFSALQKPARAGELAFDVENVDVGTVPLGQTVVQRFPMQNVGDAPVTITRRQVAVLEGC
ncbi:MAG TPA: hypothetical protein VF960_08320 [Chloroflexota bacterium]